MYLVDTNVLILALKGAEPDKSFLKKAIQKKKICISAISVGEFLSRSTAEADNKLNKLVAKCPILPIDLETARVAASYRQDSLKQKRVHLLDCFLAAQAKLNNLVLATNNKADFPMKDIKIERP